MIGNKELSISVEKIDKEYSKIVSMDISANNIKNSETESCANSCEENIINTSENNAIFQENNNLEVQKDNQITQPVEALNMVISAFK